LVVMSVLKKRMAIALNDVNCLINCLKNLKKYMHATIINISDQLNLESIA